MSDRVKLTVLLEEDIKLALSKGFHRLGAVEPVEIGIGTFYPPASYALLAEWIRTVHKLYIDVHITVASEKFPCYHFKITETQCDQKREGYWIPMHWHSDDCFSDHSSALIAGCRAALNLLPNEKKEDALFSKKE